MIPEVLRSGSLWRRLVSWLGVGILLIAGPLLMLDALHLVGNNLLYDFQGGMFNAGVAILHGHSPYQPGFLSHQVALMKAGHVARGETTGSPFSIPVYPAFANLLMVPFALLPFWLAGVLWTLLSAAAMVLALRLLGVRDWRCHALTLISFPFLYGLFLGAVGPFLVLGIAAAWRWRGRVLVPALAVASIVVAKIFPWPVGIWLLITRRLRAAALSVGLGVVLTFGAWAVIGFDGMSRYPQMLSDLSLLQENRASSVVGVLSVAGVPAGVASAVAVLLGVGILGLAWRLARRSGGDRRALGLAVLAALTATPIVWPHYMVLLVVPLALISPRFSRLWLLPLLPALIPLPAKVGPYSPNLLRTDVPWLVVELAIGFMLATTAEQRGRLRARLALGRWSRPRVPAGAAAARG
jgi:hypothetical protein